MYRGNNIYLKKKNTKLTACPTGCLYILSADTVLSIIKVLFSRYYVIGNSVHEVNRCKKVQS